MRILAVLFQTMSPSLNLTNYRTAEMHNMITAEILKNYQANIETRFIQNLFANLCIVSLVNILIMLWCLHIIPPFLIVCGILLAAFVREWWWFGSEFTRIGNIIWTGESGNATIGTLFMSVINLNLFRIPILMIMTNLQELCRFSKDSIGERYHQNVRLRTNWKHQAQVKTYNAWYVCKKQENTFWLLVFAVVGVPKNGPNRGRTRIYYASNATQPCEDPLREKTVQMSHQWLWLWITKTDWHQ